MIISFIRTLILYGLVIIALRIMGKRQIGEMQPSELVVAIMISDLATVPMSEPGIPLLYGIIPIFTLVISEIILSFLCLKNEKIRSIISGRPSVVMLKGVIDEKEMRKLRFNLSELTEEIRLLGYYDVSQIDTIVVETNGQLTVIPKAKYKVPDCTDLGISADEDELPYILISDGRLNEANFKKTGFDDKWLKDKINEKGGKQICDVFCMTYFKNECFVQLKSGKGGRKKRKTI